MFTLLGLRHLVVVNEASHVRGLITRRDLDHAAGHGSWRRNKIANGPETPGPQGPYSTAPAFMFLFPTRRGPAACSSDDAAFKPQPPLEVLCTMQPIWSLVLLTTERPSASYDAGTVPQSNCIIPRQYLA